MNESGEKALSGESVNLAVGSAPNREHEIAEERSNAEDEHIVSVGWAPTQSAGRGRASRELPRDMGWVQVPLRGIDVHSVALICVSDAVFLGYLPPRWSAKQRRRGTVETTQN